MDKINTKTKKNNPQFLKKREIVPKALTEALYVFLFLISSVYAGLIWSTGEILRREKVYDLVPHNLSSAREKSIKESVKGFPIEKMAGYISRQDKKTAAFLLGIAKKESNWGKFSPKKDGQECFNYWGYRGTYNKTASGYSCFDSPGQAVAVVGKRIRDFIEKDIDTSRELVVWKCGWDDSCIRTPQAEKWIADVEYYYRKF